MSLVCQFADHATVRTPLGETEYRDVYLEVSDGVLTVQRASRPLAWFAPGSWQVSFL